MVVDIRKWISSGAFFDKWWPKDDLTMTDQTLIFWREKILKIKWIFGDKYKKNEMVKEVKFF